MKVDAGNAQAATQTIQSGVSALQQVTTLLSNLQQIAEQAANATTTASGRQALITAAQADLQQPAVLRAQVRRLLKDPKASSFVDNFSGQWLQLRNLEVHKPDPEKFPKFNEALAKAMGLKDRTRIERIVRERQPVTADTALRLARVFGTTPELWLNLQSAHDLSKAAIESLSALAEIQRLDVA